MKLFIKNAISRGANKKHRRVKHLHLRKLPAIILFVLVPELSRVLSVW